MYHLILLSFEYSLMIVSFYISYDYLNTHNKTSPKKMALRVYLMIDHKQPPFFFWSLRTKSLPQFLHL